MLQIFRAVMFFKGRLICSLTKENPVLLLSRLWLPFSLLLFWQPLPFPVIWAFRPKLLEVNPNPGWCWDGHLAKMADHAGISYSGMLAAILEAAKERYGLGITEKTEIPCKIPESARRKSPAECAAEFEEEVEASSSMDSEDDREQNVFSDPSEAVQAFEGYN